MSTFSLPKTYDFASTERRLYQWWEENGWFKPENSRDPAGEPFVISIPPPNVTGMLHQGHALFVTLEDLMIRYQRMRGRAALWVPGTDHAGIATQLQVEKKLRDEAPAARKSAATNSWKSAGPGPRNTMAASSARSGGWAPAATGNASASLWMTASAGL